MSSEQNKEPVMPSKQGDVGLLQEPVAQQLLQSKGPAHLAYTWRDGTPRVIPMGFHWNGQDIVMATAADAPKTHAMRNEVVRRISGRKGVYRKVSGLLEDPV
jgi:hypothetical protein